MMKYVIYDMNDTEVFDTEEEARERVEEWIGDAAENTADAWRHADPETALRWDMEDSFYVSNNDISVQIRLLEVNTDVFEGDIMKSPFYEGMEDGIERIDYWWTDSRTLLGDDFVDNVINQGELYEEE